MIFDDMVAEIRGWTKRPDMDSRAESAIRAVTLKYHRRQKFFKDLATVPVTNPDPSTGIFTLDIPTNFPQWRQFALVQATGFTKGLDIVTPDDLLDADGYARQGIMLVAGTSLNIKDIAGFPTYTVTYYKDPVVWPKESYSSWIADEQPDLIIAGAAKRLFAFDNESEIFKAASIEEAEQWQTLVESNLEAVGR